MSFRVSQTSYAHHTSPISAAMTMGRSVSRVHRQLRSYYMGNKPTSLQAYKSTSLAVSLAVRARRLFFVNCSFCDVCFISTAQCVVCFKKLSFLYAINTVRVSGCRDIGCYSAFHLTTYFVVIRRYNVIILIFVEWIYKSYDIASAYH